MDQPIIIENKSTMYRMVLDGVICDVTLTPFPPTAGRLSISMPGMTCTHLFDACGADFEGFVASLSDVTYLAQKMGMAERIDKAATLQAWKDEILRSRRWGGLSEKKAKELMDEIEALDANVIDSSLEDEVRYCPHLYTYYDFAPPLVKGVSVAFERMWHTYWPALVAHLKERQPKAAKRLRKR